ncbi:hypothetical protein [Paraburkholderia graminis]|uniref:Uncharacterized protein n=1 Tax=Paraburkholderia graminis (strain ATCC 700544 / DSM 17151 / LMG 18924 / NCIMB 13744 / C4D1M) TaxID=396598 RepID=B1FZJ3_PARG4|nr:hypothetical protein [Paraburkholderia graminis]EDT10389.1 hypothetical protein BgramDRAFT_2539 [Paraburkholderia graminis C4D1M]
MLNILGRQIARNWVGAVFLSGGFAGGSLKDSRAAWGRGWRALSSDCFCSCRSICCTEWLRETSKLLAMVGAWIGPLLVFEAALATCLIGGVWLLALTARRRQFRKALGNVLSLVHPAMRGGGAASIESVGSVPYGVAIATGTVVVLLATAAQL